jgi:helicase
MQAVNDLIKNAFIAKKLLSWNITELTDVQIKAIDKGLLDGASLIVSSPTSSGKTLIAEIAALRAIDVGMRVLYLVSHRALADQKYSDFQKRFGSDSSQPISTIGLSTGDRSEGDADAQLRIATYEKAIGLIMSGQLSADNTLVVADELQILCDPTRGPDIETLCAIFRQRKVKQFVALTATVENPGDLADWMGCTLVQSSVRGTPLYQEIWTDTKRFKVTFGEETISEATSAQPVTNLSKVVSQLITDGFGPVLVFAETRREASEWAADFVRTRPKSTLGISISDQLELFSEPTDASEKLRQSAERCVAFHTADLSAQERQVLEEGFAKSQFEACFATSTLAAGVNYPFRTIVFPKLAFQYREPGARLSLAEYRNMSGRAGRLGLHQDGRSILIPKGPVELAHAQNLVQPRNEVLKSLLLQLSIRKTLLSLIASRIANTPEAIEEFFRNTLYWHKVLDKNVGSQAFLQSRSRQALAWLVENGLIAQFDDEVRITSLGKAAAMSGLLPETVVQFASMLKKNHDALENDFDNLADGLIYAACGSGEFCAEKPSRMLPFPPSTAFGGLAFWGGKTIPVTLDNANQRLLQSSYAIALYTTGLAERKIAYATGVTAGMTQRFAYDVAWVLEGLQRISMVPNLELSQSVSNQIAQLARRVRWGVPADTLDLLRVAEKHRVPGLGRQRAMELVGRGWSTFQDVIGAGKEKLFTVLKNSLRVEALLQSLNVNSGHAAESLAAAHIRIAHSLGIGPIIESCYGATGVEYEKAILELLQGSEHIQSVAIDDGSRQNVPDLLLKCGDLEVLMECKTSSKSHGLITKEDAWAVLQKAADFAAHPRRVTLGKSGFDESAKRKAAATKDLTLVENEAFIEAVLRLLIKEIDSKAFMNWLREPGLSELERLPGRYSYNLR